MSKAHIHAESSARRFGGKAEDYLDIHELLDSSRAAFPDLRHRAITHTSWFITIILPRIFGGTRTNSDNKEYSVRDIGEQHVLEDYGGNFIPSAQDFLEEIEFQDWMDNSLNNEVPPSRKKLSDLPKRPPNVSEQSPWHTQVDDADNFNYFLPRDCGGPGVID